jgi:hypothetical protein
LLRCTRNDKAQLQINFSKNNPIKFANPKH